MTQVTAMNDAQLTAHLKETKVRYLIAGKELHVPLGYHWLAYMKRGKHWPRPKPHAAKAAAFELHMLLPGLEPFSPGNVAAFNDRRGHGDVLSLLVQDQPPPRLARDLKQDMEESIKSGWVTALPPCADAPGLIGYAREASLEEIFFSESNTSEYFGIDCYLANKPSDSPACHIHDYSGGFHLTYSYARRYLPQWRDIHGQVIALLASFEQPRTLASPKGD